MSENDSLFGGLFSQGSALRMILEYLVKGTLLTGGLTVFQNLRGKVKSALYMSVLQVVFFAFLLYLIDYTLPTYLPTG